MTKKKSNRKVDKQPLVLTEWQKRNVEFIQKKKEKEEEERILKEKLRIEKKAQVLPEAKENDQADETETEAESESESDNAPLKKKANKKPKVKKIKTKRQIAFLNALPVLLISLMVITLCGFILSPYSKNKTFEAKGNEHSTLVEIVKQSQIKHSDYFFTLIFNAKRFENAIKAENPWVKSINLDYQFPNHFIFRVKEYKIIAYSQVTNGFQPILENGKRVDIIKENELPNDYLVINLTNEQDIQDLVSSLTKLPDSLVKNIKSISLANSESSKDLLIIELYDGNSIRVPQSQLELKLPFYQKLKNNLPENSIIDMEVGIYSTTAEIEAKNTSDKSEKVTDLNTTQASSEQGNITPTDGSATPESSTEPSTETTESHTPSTTETTPTTENVDPNTQPSDTPVPSQ